MIHVDALDVSECHSEEVMFLLTLSVLCLVPYICTAFTTFMDMEMNCKQQLVAQLFALLKSSILYA